MGRFFGYVFLTLALVALGYDVWRGPMKDLPLEFSSTLDLWAGYDLQSLTNAEAFVRNSLAPDFWTLFILPAISWPAYVLAGVIGIVFLLLNGRRRPKSGMMFPRGRR